MAYVAAGRYDGYFQKNLKVWDIAAGALIVTEAGGLLNDIDYENIKIPSIIATNSDINTKLKENLGNF